LINKFKYYLNVEGVAMQSRAGAMFGLVVICDGMK
jgi:hypothetical protein